MATIFPLTWTPSGGGGPRSTAGFGAQIICAPGILPAVTCGGQLLESRGFLRYGGPDQPGDTITYFLDAQPSVDSIFPGGGLCIQLNGCMPQIAVSTVGNYAGLTVVSWNVNYALVGSGSFPFQPGAQLVIMPAAALPVPAGMV